MEQWRERGYVPDSDEGEEFDSQELLGGGGPVIADDDGTNIEETGCEIQQHGDRGGDVAEEETQREDEGGIGGSSQRTQIPSEEDLDTDPLQDYQTLLQTFLSPSKERKRRPDGSENVENAISQLEPPSSPDELQFEEFRSQPPYTPLAKKTVPDDDMLLDSLNSSPLSSVPPVLNSPLSREASLAPPQNDTETLPLQQQETVQPNEGDIDMNDLGLLELQNQSHRRALRQRNAIQLHPYMLENAQYRSLLRNRGVQPVRIPNDEPQPHNNTGESQSFDSQDENVPPSSSPSYLPPSSPGNYDQPALSQSLSDPDQTRQREELRVLHDTNSQLRSTRPNKVGNKRRKISHIMDSHLSRNSTQNAETRLQVVINTNSSPKSQKQDDLQKLYDIFDVPPSPPSSGEGSSTLPRDPDTFRFPPGFAPNLSRNQLQTPVSEKVTQLGPPDIISSDSSLVIEPEEEDVTLIAEEPAYGHSSDSPEEEEEEDLTIIRDIQRRIKGVLPASFARLDHGKHEQYRKQAVERERRRALNPERRTGKGVAQPVSRRERTENQQETPTRTRGFDLFSDSESDDDATPTRSEQQKKRELLEQKRLERHFGLFDDDDIPEDNRIDYMAPPTSRRSTSKKSSREKRKGQSSERIDAEPRPSRQSNPQRKRQTRITDSIGHRRKSKPSKPRAPKLGILDSEDVRAQSVNTQPQFLRIAARQARSRKDKGRRSPSRKVLKLATRADTRDANASLHNWRRGKYQPTPGITSARPRTIPKPQTSAQPSPTISGEDDGSGNLAIRASSIPGGNTEPIIIDDDDDENSTEHLSCTKPNKRQQTQKNNWVVQRPYGITSFQRHVPRPAQLDIEDIPSPFPQRPSTFHGTLAALRKAYKTSSQPLTLTRFLNEPQRPQPQQPTVEAPAPIPQSISSRPDNEPKKQRISKKKSQPKHINVETVEYRQPPDFDNGISDTASFFRPEEDGFTVLPGLHRPERPYQIDFDTHPLYIGTYYHQSTFIGSGKFSRSLRLYRDLDIDHGHCTIRHIDKIYKWGPWNETVSSELGELFTSIASQTSSIRDDAGAIPTFPSQVLGPYQDIICYVSEHMSFIDPVDRIGLISRCTGFVSQLTETFLPNPNHEVNTTALAAGVEMFNLVFLNQLLQVSKHETMDLTRVRPVVELMKLSAQRVMDSILTPAGVRNIQQFLEDNRKLEIRETGIRDDYPFVDAFVIAQHILQQKSVKDMGLQVRFLDRATVLPHHSIQDLERAWEAIFISLPFQELDELGIFQPGLRFQLHNDQWPVVKQLLSKIFESYRSNAKEHWISLNNYLRTLLHRCFILIKGWGWRHCKPALEMLFDFFTRNSLYDLEKEPVHGSPRFLERLDSDPVLEIETSDSCFRMFLKIIVIGFRYLNTLLEPKQMLNLVWRLLPNHGRTYPKENPLRVEDLNALRNHHDLLCALYCCSPKGSRPHLSMIQRLVHPPTSHRDACSINIHSWSRLARFTLIKDGNTADMGKFAEWHGDFITEILKQHSQARSEIEAEATSATFFPRQYIEGAIAKNERHAESLMSDALACMKLAIDATRDADQAGLLMEKMPLGRIFGIFNPTVKRRDVVIFQALNVLNSFARADSRTAATVSTAEGPVDPSETNEDSQDDWLDLCQDQLEVSSTSSSYLNRAIAPAIAQFISTCFGVDQTPDDSILTKTIDCWLTVAQARVQHGMRQWSSYFNRYDQDSWPALKSTDQTRKFMPYFISRLISSDPTSYEECRPHILTYWSASLVERELFLKYQHDLMNALLNEDYKNPLFRNLPFAANRTSGKYEITLTDFCQRRVSLISCVLSNMRVHLSELPPTQIYAPNGFGETYQEMIRTMMATMKQNSEEAGKTVLPGSYVDFVHRVVELLQVHSEDIYPVDKYFMDPASFPLPASDPNYVVAKLKRYAGRISGGSRFAKQLVTYIQGVSERAAVDAQQSYLAGQFYEAMSDASEGGGYERPSLRCFLLQCVIPEYVAVSINNPTAWIVARPLIQATTRIFSNLVMSVDCTKPDEVSIAITSITAYFGAVYTVLQYPINDPSLLQESSVLLTLTSIFESIIASLAMVDYLDRLGQEATDLLSYIEFFGQTALFSLSSLLDPPAPNIPYLRDLTSNSPDSQHVSPPAFFTESRNFAARELESWLEENWTVHEGKYFVRRGQQYTRIDVNLGTLSSEVAKTAFIQTIQALFGAIETLCLF
ncbi:hypothetical protein MGYG_02256 [Nannizzia gypsea CBS 118893]|uniref:Uncharacterized protein n=1 Tax=Arthroderma gypseum (strain ATCC MYA-4604 / CBS 118893) TaxID=535722 RepID=E4UQL4_ARTGP|nr:hypothetical protein MGYG_02256 [Nannizzia gypsea CBS 118893]EFQ99243.1 hypothetical protein MGYG_02256 [Nannizzia gypsea CBS 118893]